jgi:hypothetical protein
MIDCVKGGREIKENECGNLLAITGKENIVRNAKKGGLSGMELAVSGLKSCKQ